MSSSDYRLALDVREQDTADRPMHGHSSTPPWTQLTLRELVETALSRSSYLAGKNLRFEVHADDVVLRGVVHSYYQKQLAQESLRSIVGVGRIQNEIEVLST